jgi:hypothetical protein
MNTEDVTMEQITESIENWLRVPRPWYETVDGLRELEDYVGDTLQEYEDEMEDQNV